MLSIHTLKSGSNKKKKRVGRGNASGHGTYSGKGLKGQKSRSGVSGLKLRGLKAIAFKLPKNKGFVSKKAKNHVIEIVAIGKHFKDGETVNPEALLCKGLIKDTKKPVKILGNSKIAIKNIIFENVLTSQSVKNNISGNE